jgi:hypothetical protein
MRSRSPERERRAAEDREKCSGLGLGQGRIFLKTSYGRTGQSTVPVRCTPDSAQCSVRCTPDCPVIPDRGNFDIFQIFYLVFNQTKSQLIITQKNTCWDRYWHPHIFSHNFQNIFP